MEKTMKRKLFFILSVFSSIAMLAQTPDVKLSLFVKDNITSSAKELNFGLAQSATDGIDATLGEAELPPAPPVGIFDARFVGTNINPVQLGNGSIADYRQGNSTFKGVKHHQVQWQNTTGATKIVLLVDLPQGVSINFGDFFGGFIVSKIVSGKDSVVITNLAVTTLLMYVNYNLGATSAPSIPVLVSPLNGAIINSYQLSLMWQSVADADEYQVQAAKDSLFTQIVKDVFEPTIKVSIGPLENKTLYFWRVRSKNSNGTSEYSLPWKFIIDVPTTDTSVHITVMVKDNLQGIPKVLTFGLNPNATDGIDASLGEAELPPAPPTGVFDARFVGTNISLSQLGNGTLKDYRKGSSAFIGEKIHQVQWQNNTGAAKVVLSLALPQGTTAKFEDFFGGVIVNKTISGSDSIVVTNLAITTLKMTVTYNFTPVTPPSVPVLVSPKDSAEINSTNISLIWNRSIGAEQYRCQVSNDEKFTTLLIDSLLADSLYVFHTEQLGEKYFWRVQALNKNSASEFSAARMFKTGTTPSVKKYDELTPKEFLLEQNYPNPFNPTTVISFSIPAWENLTGLQDLSGLRVSLKIYDALGREVAELVNEIHSAGNYSVLWNAAENTSGVYFYQLKAGKYTSTKRMTLMK